MQSEFRQLINFKSNRFSLTLEKMRKKSEIGGSFPPSWVRRYNSPHFRIENERQLPAEDPTGP